MGTATSQKAIAELQGRIASGQNLIQNEMVRMQLFQMIAAAEDKIMQQRANEAWYKGLRNENPQPKKYKVVEFK